ncbi:hypothetical protein [Acidaminococcus intestini]
MSFTLLPKQAASKDWQPARAFASELDVSEIEPPLPRRNGFRRL